MNLLPSRVPLPLDTVTHADALSYLRGLPDNTVNCVVTSPPYFGLRDYGVEGQIGLEDTPVAFVAKMVELFREVRRVLRGDGTCWVNLGDSYASGEVGRHDKITPGSTVGNDAKYDGVERQQTRLNTGLAPKNLLMIPARVAIALQDDGWILRSEIVWHKPNPMPESVTDRPTKSHEMVYMLAKAERYWYDADAIREPNQPYEFKTSRNDGSIKGVAPHPGRDPRTNDAIRKTAGRAEKAALYNPAGRNKRTVWTIATSPTPFAHFATFPQKLIEPMILAGCPHKVCTVCGSPWVRQIEYAPSLALQGTGWTSGAGVLRNDGDRPGSYIGGKRETLGFAPTCSHDAPTRPGIVLDPFMGSGTTALVARRLGRHYMGSELNAEYVSLCRERLAVPYTMPMFEMLEVAG